MSAVSPDKARKIVARSITERITRNCSTASSCVVMPCFAIQSRWEARWIPGEITEEQATGC
jgi:hypothetical protein